MIDAETRKIVSEELEKRSMRWSQEHKANLQLVEEIYREKIFGDRIKAIAEREQKIEAQQQAINNKFADYERESKEFQIEKDSIFALDASGQRFYVFARAVSNLYAIMGKVGLPDTAMICVKDILVAYLESYEVKEG